MTESSRRQSATFRSHAYRSSHSKGAGNSRKIKCAHKHSYLFVILPPLTLPLSIFLACHTNPSACILWLVLRCLDSTTFSQFLVPEFFTNTKLVGISCLCVPHRNIPWTIKGTSFKWGEKVGQGESWESVCVCVCVFWTHKYGQEEIMVYKEVKWKNQRDFKCQ